MTTELQTQTPGRTTVEVSGRMAVADIISHVALVQEVMRAVMKPDVHFGVIPGTDKPSLFKQGAEVLCMAFRVADSYQVEDLSTNEVVRYRVTCVGTHQVTGLVLGTGMGEASSAEEKYKWRKAYKDEFEATPTNLRREKKGWDKTKRQAYTVTQVRTEPADLANTILKMANKRAKVAMTINVTACGDMFGQDLEDMDEALRDHLTRRGERQPAPEPDPTPAPATPAREAWPAGKFAEQFPRWEKAVANGLKTSADILAFALTKGDLTDRQRAQILALRTAGAEDATTASPQANAERVAETA